LNRFRDLFPGRLPVIGLIHLPPLPDYPDSPGIDTIVEGALADLDVLQAAGFDGVLVENEYDRPHRVTAAPATIDAMTRITRACADAAGDVVVGCEILLHDPRASLNVALDSGAGFVRNDYFVDRMSRPGFGEFEIDPDALLDYRSVIGAEHVLILADVQVKYATMLESRTLTESARLACEKGADAVVITGDATGNAPNGDALRRAAAGASVPVLIGSGLDPKNAARLLAGCAGAIVGTALMRNKRVDPIRTGRLMDEVRRLRAT